MRASIGTKVRRTVECGSARARGVWTSGGVERMADEREHTGTRVDPRTSSAPGASGQMGMARHKHVGVDNSTIPQGM